MPLFFFISGLFYDNNKLANKVLYYLNCGFMLKIVLCICGILLLHKPKFSLLSDSYLPWFLFVLAIYYCITSLLDKNKINKNYFLLFNIMLACFVGYDKSIGDYLYLSRSIIFYPFFLMGTMYSSDRVLELRYKYARLLIPFSIVIMLLWVYLCFAHLQNFYFLRPLFTGRNPFSEAVSSYGPLIRLLCYMITTLTGMALIALCPDKHLSVITFMGSKTLNVYFWNWPVFLIIKHFIPVQKLMVSGKVSYIIIYALFGVILCILLSEVRCFDFPLKQIKKYCSL